MQLWKGRFKKELSKTTNDFNSSISFDSRMYKEDIEGSIAHATMLGRCGIIKEEEANDIVKGLKGILADIENGTLHIDMEAEDIHTFIEGELTTSLGISMCRVPFSISARMPLRPFTISFASSSLIMPHLPSIVAWAMLPSMSSLYILLSNEIELLKSLVVFESSFLKRPFQSCIIISPYI